MAWRLFFRKKNIYFLWGLLKAHTATGECVKCLDNVLILDTWKSRTRHTIVSGRPCWDCVGIPPGAVPRTLLESSTCATRLPAIHRANKTTWFPIVFLPRRTISCPSGRRSWGRHCHRAGIQGSRPFIFLGPCRTFSWSNCWRDKNRIVFVEMQLQGKQPTAFCYLPLFLPGLQPFTLNSLISHDYYTGGYIHLAQDNTGREKSVPGKLLGVCTEPSALVNVNQEYNYL